MFKNEIRLTKKNIKNKKKKINVTWKTGLKLGNFILTDKLLLNLVLNILALKSKIKTINDPYQGFKIIKLLFKNMYKDTFHKQHNNHYNIVSILDKL